MNARLFCIDKQFRSETTRVSFAHLAPVPRDARRAALAIQPGAPDGSSKRIYDRLSVDLARVQSKLQALGAVVKHIFHLVWPWPPSTESP